ncbi:MAG: Gfo/Idh/MocA family oxidoreductase [Candidatus Latescibacteria bacterium]|nr:Gfo/Idh/MocA family oxidoreductase [Candidatus Latescibacterota bacterium]
MNTLRFGCIGCGGMGTLHVLNARHIPGMDVVAYADVQKEKAEKFLKEFGGEYATDDPARVFADASLDGVLIQTGERHHPALGIAAAKAGKHIFMEKPIAVTVEEALELEKAVRQAGVKYLIGLCNRLAPAVKRAKALLPNPWITFGQCTDTVSGQACHNLDLIVHQFHDAPLVSVYASGGHYYGLDAHLPADSFIATLRFADGSQACYIQHGRAYNALMSKYSFQLFGKDRCVFLAQRFKDCHLSTSLTAPDFSTIFSGPNFSPVNPEAHFKDVRGPHGYMGHYDELVALCEAIRQDTDPPMTVEEGRHVLQVEKAIFESLTTGQIVDHAQFLARWDTRQPVRRRM